MGSMVAPSAKDLGSLLTKAGSSPKADLQVFGNWTRLGLFQRKRAFCFWNRLFLVYVVHSVTHPLGRQWRGAVVSVFYSLCSFSQTIVGSWRIVDATVFVFCCTCTGNRILNVTLRYIE